MNSLPHLCDPHDDVSKEIDKWINYEHSTKMDDVFEDKTDAQTDNQTTKQTE